MQHFNANCSHKTVYICVSQEVDSYYNCIAMKVFNYKCKVTSRSILFPSAFSSWIFNI